jgi:thiopurine S-methyltransferase
MEAAFWHQRWESNEIGFNQKQPNALMCRYFSLLNLSEGSRIFVPLCGKSIDMLWLAAQGYEVVGVELSSIACDAFFKENQIPVEATSSTKFIIYKSEKITVFSGDLFNLTKEMLGRVDGVFDRAALVALPADLLRKYVSFLSHLLEPEVPIFLIAGTYDQQETDGPPFSVDENEVGALYGGQFTIKKLHSYLEESLPAHLHKKGLTKYQVDVYHLLLADHK